MLAIYHRGNPGVEGDGRPWAESLVVRQIIDEKHRAAEECVVYTDIFGAATAFHM